MPLKKGKSKETISKNISELEHSYKKTGKLGNSKPESKEKAHKQAVAIAMSEAGKTKNESRKFDTIVGQILKESEQMRHKIELEVSDQALEELLPLLKELKRMGSAGCSRNIVIEDYDGQSKFGFDGDGSSKITSIKVDGQEPKD